MLNTLERIIVIWSVHSRMPHTKQVVELIKNNNSFNITYKFG